MKFVIVNETRTLCPSNQIHPVLLAKYPDAIIWYRTEEQVGVEVGTFGAKISKLERTKEEVGQYLVPCVIVDADA